MATSNFMTFLPMSSSQFSLSIGQSSRSAEQPSFANGVPGLVAIESKSIIGKQNGVLDDDLFELFSEIDD